MINFVFVMLELFSLSLTVETLQAEICRSRHFSKAMVISANISGGRGQFIPSNPRWSGKTRDIPVSYGVEILTDNYFVLSQYTHLTDRRTDGQTELRQQYRALHYMQSHGNKASRAK